jgi:hypothetical protein
MRQVIEEGFICPEQSANPLRRGRTGGAICEGAHNAATDFIVRLALGVVRTNIFLRSPSGL